MNYRMGHLLFRAATGVFVAGLLLSFISLSRDFPYYFTWDMDLVTCLDTVFIHSDRLPQHLNHPSFGMYLMMFFTEQLGHWSGSISVLSLDELSRALNPLAAMAELTTFLRMHSPFLAVGLILFLWFSLCSFFDLSGWLRLLLLGILGMQESLVYHVTMIRSEFYSVFYWSAAVALLSLGLRVRTSGAKAACMLVGGMAAGLCLLTKLQGMPYLLALGPILILQVSVFGHGRDSGDTVRRQEGARVAQILSLFNIAAFLALAALSYNVVSDSKDTVYSALHYRSFITPSGPLLLTIFVVLLVMQRVLSTKKLTSSIAFQLSWYFTLISAGFILSFAFHFLLYGEFDLSWRLLLYDFKVVFFRGKYWETTRFLDRVQYYGVYLKYNAVPFLVLIGLNILLALGSTRRWLALTRKQLLLCCVLTAFVLANIVISTRPILRDNLWREILMNYVSLLFFVVIVSKSVRRRKLLISLGTTALAVLLVTNVRGALEMPYRIDDNWNLYGWKSAPWVDGYAETDDVSHYVQIMNERYGDDDTIRAATLQARRHQSVRRTADFVFQNQDVTHRNIGMVREKMPVWVGREDYRIVKAPLVLRDAILVDNVGLPLKRNRFRVKKEKESSKLNEYMKITVPLETSGAIAVLPRSDLEVLVFVEKESVAAIATETVTRTSHTITVSNGETSIELHGLTVSDYTELALKDITNRAFFVIRRSYLMRPVMPQE